MALENLSKSAIELNGWTWTIFEHVIALGYITLFLWLISKWLKFKNKDLKLALYLSSIGTVMSLVIEILLPVKLALIGLPFLFIISTILIKIFYKENWKKSSLSALILVGLVLGANFIMAIFLEIYRLLT